MRLAPFLALVATTWGAEQIVLTTGFRIRAERHQQVGDRLKIFTSHGEIEVGVETVALIEQEEFVPPPPARLPPLQTATQSVPLPTLEPRQLLDHAAARYGLPPEFLHSVARIESGFQLGAISPKGAIGLMQLMPGTAAQLNADPHDPLQNVDAGARHLRDLLIQFQGSTHRALAAYNAGTGAVRKYQGVPPFPETRTYIEKVLKTYQQLTGSR